MIDQINPVDLDEFWDGLTSKSGFFNYANDQLQSINLAASDFYVKSYTGYEHI